jgi:hypothetical protein
MPTAPAPPTVSLARARAFTLARQGLAGDGHPSALDAVRAIGGVYGTAPTCYLSCVARVDGLSVADVDAELYERRTIVRHRAMRQSSYALAVADLPVVVGATGVGVGQAEARILRQCGLDAAGYEALAERVAAVLRGKPPLTVQELRRSLGDDAPAHREALPFAVGLMGRQCRVLRAQVRGGWHSDVYAYAAWDDWLGAPVEPLDPALARTELARRYLRAFGPATADDLRWWAGWPARDANAAVATLGDDAARVDLEGAGESLVLAQDLDALRGADPASVAGVRLLPLWDAYTMGYAARGRLVADADLPRVYDRSGNGTAVVLVDGVAAGVWELEAPAGGDLTVRVAPFAARSVPVAGVEAAAQRIAAAAGATLAAVEWAPPPGALADGARNAFKAPIRLGARPAV